MLERARGLGGQIGSKERERGSELCRYSFRSGVRVAHQHPWVPVPTDDGDFRHVETLLEEPAYRLVP